MEKKFNIGGEEVTVHDFKQTPDGVSFILDGKTYNYRLIDRNGAEMILDNGERFKAAVGIPNRDGDSMVISHGRETVGSAAGKKVKKAGAHAGGLTSPMPGKIFKIVKEIGSAVKKGETILILEAMKMEHSIRSDKDGTVAKINYQVGELVQGGVTLAEVSS